MRRPYTGVGFDQEFLDGILRGSLIIMYCTTGSRALIDTYRILLHCAMCTQLVQTIGCAVDLETRCLIKSIQEELICVAKYGFNLQLSASTVVGIWAYINHANTLQCMINGLSGITNAVCGITRSWSPPNWIRYFHFRVLHIHAMAGYMSSSILWNSRDGVKYIDGHSYMASVLSHIANENRVAYHVDLQHAALRPNQGTGNF